MIKNRIPLDPASDPAQNLGSLKRNDNFSKVPVTDPVGSRSDPAPKTAVSLRRRENFTKWVRIGSRWAPSQIPHKFWEALSEMAISARYPSRIPSDPVTDPAPKTAVSLRRHENFREMIKNRIPSDPVGSRHGSRWIFGKV